MMNRNRYDRWLLVLLIAVMAVGCASEKSNKNEAVAPTPVPGPYVAPGETTGDASSYWSYGGSAEFTVQGGSETEKSNLLAKYANGFRTNVSNIQINVNLVRRGDGFGGRVAIAYTADSTDEFGNYQTGVRHEGVFVNGDSSYFSNTNENDAARYNRWFQNEEGQPVFHGFFQDQAGAIILVIDEVESAGDGAPPETASGTIWFKNFTIGALTNVHAPTHCWFISLGPYDCRAWKKGQGVDTFAAVEPDSSYVKLGSFEGLKIEEAFNGEELGLEY